MVFYFYLSLSLSLSLSFSLLLSLVCVSYNDELIGHGDACVELFLLQQQQQQLVPGTRQPDTDSSYPPLLCQGLERGSLLAKVSTPSFFSFFFADE